MPSLISVVVPCRNEAQYVKGFVENVLTQRLPEGCGLEVLIADGMSRDGTREILAYYAERDPRIRLLDNPEGIVSTGLNRAIRQARGEVIARMDVHTSYADDYVLECVRTLERTGAANVGGPWVARGNGYLSRAAALAHRSRFGMGGGKAHVARYEGPVDTVYLGCWHRSAFDRYGLYDETIVRSQDAELNWRIRDLGGVVYQSPRIRSWYTPRGTPGALARQFFRYGHWKARLIQRHPRLASPRQFVPPVYLLLLATTAALAPFAGAAAYAAAMLAGGYVIANLLASVIACRRAGDRRYLPVMPLVFAILHLSWGLGFLVGLVRFVLLGRDRAPA